jgi:hypothetical protein
MRVCSFDMANAENDAMSKCSCCVRKLFRFAFVLTFDSVQDVPNLRSSNNSGQVILNYGTVSATPVHPNRRALFMHSLAILRNAASLGAKFALTSSKGLFVSSMRCLKAFFSGKKGQATPRRALDIFFT